MMMNVVKIRPLNQLKDRLDIFLIPPACAQSSKQSQLQAGNLPSECEEAEINHTKELDKQVSLQCVQQVIDARGPSIPVGSYYTILAFFVHSGVRYLPLTF
jgi:hypothetical protein